MPKIVCFHAVSDRGVTTYMPYQRMDVFTFIRTKMYLLRMYNQNAVATCVLFVRLSFDEATLKNLIMFCTYGQICSLENEKVNH